MIAVLLRTTVFTAVAASLALFLLWALRIRSPRIHRFVWTAVLLNGWLFFPVAVLQVPVQSDNPPPVVHETLTEVQFTSSDLTNGIGSHVSSRTADGLPAKISLTVIWLGGAILIASIGIVRYARVLQRMPLGRTPPQVWMDEWDSITDEFRLSSKAEFRMTEATGPLCCYFPFFYLILAPAHLWTKLDRAQRKAILRHELAHVIRHDVWKALAIRLLALPQWFNPFAWLAVRSFDQAAEWACDDVVMESTSDHPEVSFPAALLCVAQSHYQTLPGSAAARGGALSIRIRRMIQTDITEDSILKKYMLLTLLFGVMALHSVRLESVAAGTEADSNVTRLTDERKNDLERTGLVPYRVAPPDILSLDFSSGTDEAETTLRSGKFLVGPDGTVTLGKRGSLRVAGMTVDDIKTAIGAKLSKLGDARTVIACEVWKANSKAYFVVLERNGKSESVFRLPCRGNETVLDAIAHVDGLEDLSEKKIWVGRPMDDGIDELAVDWTAIVEDGKADTNYQLLPGDRVFVRDEGGKLKLGSNPVEQVLPSPIRPEQSAQAKQPIELPKGTVRVKVRYSSCSEIVKAIHEFIGRRTTASQRIPGQNPSKEVLTVVAERESNSVLVRGSRRDVQGMTDLIRKLDVQPDMVILELVIARALKTELADGDLKRYPKELVPWARKHGQIEILSRPQIMTRNNETGAISMSARNGEVRQRFKVEVTPRVTSDGMVAVGLSVGESRRIVESGKWTRDEVTSGTIVTAGDGEVVIVPGLRTSRNRDEPELVIAMTPHIIEREAPIHIR